MTPNDCCHYEGTLYLLSPSSTLVSTANTHTHVPAHLQMGTYQAPGSGNRHWEPEAHGDETHFPSSKTGCDFIMTVRAITNQGTHEPAKVRGVPRIICLNYS